MKIVIVGGGSVGSAICAHLVDEGHDVTVVDTDMAALTEISNICDVFGVVGNGAEVSVLKKAGAERADLLIAVTSGDEVNILCCAAAKKLGTKQTVARVRNPEYTELMHLMKNEMNLSLTINPELAAAKEIYRFLRFPYAAKIDTFCRGRVEVAEFTVSPDSILCGMTLGDLRAKLQLRLLVCSVLRESEAYIPAGNFRIEAGDTLCVTAAEDEIAAFFKTIKAYKRPVRNVLIVGGSRTTYYLETLLAKSKMASTVIEPNVTRCREFAENFPCTVICDDGTKQDLLIQEGIENADAFLALSDVDEENAIISMYAKTKNVHKTVTMIQSMSYVDLFKNVGLENIVSPKFSTATYILRYVRSMANARGSEIESLHTFMDGRVEALEFVIKDGIDGITDIPLKELRPKSGVLIACIVRRDRVIIPSGDDVMKKGDTVIVVTAGGQLKGMRDIVS